MAVLQGVDRLERQLDQHRKKYATTVPPEVVVGYTQSYAVYVHERQASHKVGNWKYLINPLRRLRNDGTLSRELSKAMRAGAKLNLALLRVGMRVQRESQLEVPVDTTALRASAFTSYGQSVEVHARAAFNRSERIRKRSKPMKRDKLGRYMKRT